MKQTGSLSEFSCLSEYTRLYPIDLGLFLLFGLVPVYVYPKEPFLEHPK